MGECLALFRLEAIPAIGTHNPIRLHDLFAGAAGGDYRIFAIGAIFEIKADSLSARWTYGS